MSGRGRTRRAIVALGTVLALAAGALGFAALTAPPAAAAPEGAVLLALDPAGPWAQNLSTSPFTGAPSLWVPGDQATGTIYVRTDACTQATGTASVSYLGTGTNGAELAEALVVTETLNGFGPVPSGSTFSITGGTINRLDVTIAFPYGSATSSDNPTQDDVVQGLAVTVTLTCPDGSETTITPTPSPAPTTTDPWVDQAGDGKVQAAAPALGFEVNATSAAGGMVAFRATNLLPGSEITVTGPDGASYPFTVGPDGIVEDSIPLPTGLAPGLYNLSLYDPVSARATTAPFPLGDTANPVLVPAPTLTVASPVQAGSPATVLAANLTPGSTVSVVGPDGQPVELLVGMDGTARGTLSVPAGTPAGTYPVKLRYTDDPDQTVVVSGLLDVTSPVADTQPAIDISSSALPGSTVRLRLHGLLATSVVQVSGPGGTTATATTDQDGVAHATLALPADLEDGWHQVVVTHADGSTTTTLVHVTSTEPANLPPARSASITVAGTVQAGGALPVGAASIPAGTTVTMTGPTGVVSTFTVGADGTYTGTIPIPADTPPGEYTVTTTLPNGHVITSPYTVTAAPDPGTPDPSPTTTSPTTSPPTPPSPPSPTTSPLPTEDAGSTPPAPTPTSPGSGWQAGGSAGACREGLCPPRVPAQAPHPRTGTELARTAAAGAVFVLTGVVLTGLARERRGARDA